MLNTPRSWQALSSTSNLRISALILAPTRELAKQILDVVTALGDYLDVRIHMCVGGTSAREDQKILREGVHIVIGTPGRCYHMINEGSLRLDDMKLFCKSFDLFLGCAAIKY